MFQLPLIEQKHYFSHTNPAINLVHYIAIQHMHNTSFLFIGWEMGVGGLVNSILEVSGKTVHVN